MKDPKMKIWVQLVRENSFGSATFEVAKGQKVISTGPYATVRNPMYSSAVVYLIGVPLALGSYWGLVDSAHGKWFEKDREAELRRAFQDAHLERVRERY